MTGKVVLDTSVIVAALRRLPGTMDRLRGAEELIVPSIALGELNYGANRAKRTAEQRAAIAAFMAGATLRTVSVETTEAYGKIKADLAKAGTPLPENDIWIAAFAVELGLELATRDKHFHAIAGLRVLDWS